MNRKLFPSCQEKLISVAIFAFIGGGILAFFVNFKINDNQLLLQIVATLTAAFIGAWTAFHLESKARKNEERQKRIDAANSLIYALMERSSIINYIKTDIIDPKRDDKVRFMSIEPIRDFKGPDFKILVQDISYIFQTKYRYLVVDLHIINQQFEYLIKAIRNRSDIHLDKVQPLLEKAGLKKNDMLTIDKLEEVIGNRYFNIIQTTTNSMIKSVDDFVIRIDLLQNNLINAFNDIFTEDEIFDVKVLTKSINKTAN